MNWLRVFEAAARMESFAGAATLLNMSTSAVSQQISALEKSLGTELFIRGPRSVTLSEAGFQFLPHIRQALASIESSAAAIRGRSKASVVRVMANSIFAMSWLAPRLPDFAEKHPDIEIHLINMDYVLEARVEEAEVLITIPPAPHTWVHFAHILSERLYPVANATVAATITAVEDLIGHRLLEVPTHTRSWPSFLQQFVATESRTPKFMFLSTTNVALSLAAAGHGVALARAPVTDWLIDQFGLVECLPGFDYQCDTKFVVSTRPMAQTNDHIKAFQNWILETARDQTHW